MVSTTFPGADAATIEQSVAAPIEQQVNGVPHMIYMDSKSASDGSYTLTVTFEVGTDQDIAAVDVQNQVAIAQRQLPQQVLQQGITVAKRQPQILLVVSIGSDDPRYDALFLSNFATLRVYDALARVKGVGQVTILGARDYGMRIWLDPKKMASLNVTTQDVSDILNEQNTSPRQVRSAASRRPRAADAVHRLGQGAPLHRAGIRRHRGAHRHRRRHRAPARHRPHRARCHQLRAVGQASTACPPP